MHPVHVFSLTTILMAGTITQACKPSSQHRNIAQVQYVAQISDKEKKDANTEAQRTSNTHELEILKRTFDEKFRDNEIRIAELKAKMKRISTLERTNKKLKASIEIYQQGEVDWELFKRAFNSDMIALENELKDLSRYTKK